MSTSFPRGPSSGWNTWREDAPGAIAFYKDALGYTAERIDGGANVEYFALKVG